MSRRTNTCTIDHRPDPEPKEAAAPKTPPSAARVGRTLLDSMRAADGLPPRHLANGLRVSLEEARRRTLSAARMSIPWDLDGGEGWKTAAADVLADLAAKAHVETHGATWCPRREHCRMVYLKGLLSNWLRAETLRRERAADVTAEENIGAPMSALVTDSETPGLPERAAVLASAKLADMLDCPGVAALAYDALRDGTGDEKAAERGMSPAAYRKGLQRARESVQTAFPTPLDLLSALSLVDRADAGSSRSPHRTRHPEIGETWLRRNHPETPEDIRSFSDRSWRMTPPRGPLTDDAGWSARRAARQAERTLTRWGLGPSAGWMPAEVETTLPVRYGGETTGRRRQMTAGPGCSFYRSAWPSLEDRAAAKKPGDLARAARRRQRALRAASRDLAKAWHAASRTAKRDRTAAAKAPAVKATARRSRRSRASR